MSKSSVLLAVPNKAQLASPTGNSQPEKVVPCLQPSATLASLPSSTRQSNWRVPWSSNRQWHWSHQCHVSKAGQTRQWLLRVVCFLCKKRHHTKNSLKRGPYQELVSKRSLYEKICLRTSCMLDQIYKWGNPHVTDLFLSFFLKSWVKSNPRSKIFCM